MSRALLFDFDGTLANNVGDLRGVYGRFMRAHGKPPSNEEFDGLVGPSLVEIARILKTRHGLVEEETVLHARYLAMVQEATLLAPPRAGAREVLHLAASRGWRACVVTSNHEKVVRDWLSRNGFEGYVEFVVGQESFSRAKPDPEPYQVALSRLRLSPQSCYAVEDSKAGVASATAAGLSTFALAGQDAYSFRSADNAERVRVVAGLLDLEPWITP